MSKAELEQWRIYVTIFIGLGWLVAIALWLIYLAGSFRYLRKYWSIYTQHSNCCNYLCPVMGSLGL